MTVSRGYMQSQAESDGNCGCAISDVIKARKQHFFLFSLQLCYFDNYSSSKSHLEGIKEPPIILKDAEEMFCICMTMTSQG